MSVLNKILESKRAELPALRSASWQTTHAPRPLPSQSDHLQLICEIKLRSPSAGPLSTALTVAQRAKLYQASGAAMISVLCDGPFFDGSYAHLLEARQACDLPLLCKEFILEECQLDAALAHGADAALLIARCLSSKQLESLVNAAKARNLTPLVEVYSDQEAQAAVDLGVDWIGVNARNLDTLEMDSERAQRILRQLPTGRTRLHLSGVKRPEDVRAARASGADLALVGEVLMRQDDPAPLLQQLVRAC